MRIAAALALASTGLGSLGCGSDPWTSDATSRRAEVRASLAANVVEPQLAALVATTEALAQTLTAPTASAATPEQRDAARAAFDAARDAWNPCEALLLDPPISIADVAEIDTAPVDVRRIEATLAADVPIDDAFVAALGSTQRGFHTLEHLLYVRDELAGRQLLYAAAAARRLALDAAAAAARWTSSEDGYASDFVAGRGMPTPTEAMLARTLALLETVLDQRIGLALGVDASGAPRPAGGESTASGRSRRDLIGDLAGIERLFHGAPGPEPQLGLRDQAELASPALARSFGTALAAAQAAMEAVPEPLEAAATGSERATVEQAYARTAELAESAAVELASALSTSLSFSPFDGD